MKKIILLGRPNVGKSSLFNRLAKSRIAITSDVAGTTRDTNHAQIYINDKPAILIDSGGFDESSELFISVQTKTLQEAANADIIIFMVDGKKMPDDIDKRLFFSILSLQKPTLLVVNKVDSKKDEERSWEFCGFGAKAMIATSVSHASGIDELYNWLDPLIPSPLIRADESEDFDDFIEELSGDGASEKREIDYDKKPIRVGIIGRVNVGKSSLLNALVGEARSVVSEVAGTTIDPVNESYFYEDKQIEFVDTAGIRRRGKIEGIEKFALNRTQKILEQSDIALLVLDASEPFSELDERIAGLAAKFELGVIIVLNKWDKEHGDFDKVATEIRDKFKFLSYAPIISVSAAGGKRIHKVYPLILEVYKNFTQSIKTSYLNAILEEAVKMHPIPRDHGKIVKIFFAAQIGFAPPKIALISNKPKSLHFSYKRYLINQLRQKCELAGSPVILIPKHRKKDDDEAN